MRYSIDVEDEAAEFIDELSDIFGFMFQTLVMDPRSKISVKYEILNSNQDVEVDYIEYNQLQWLKIIEPGKIPRHIMVGGGGLLLVNP